MWDMRVLTFHVIWMWELDHKEGRALKNWCFWTLMLEKTLESPLEKKEIRPVKPKGNQPWIFIGKKLITEAEAPICRPLDANSWLIGKDPDAGKDWRQEEKGTTEDEIVGWHHLFNGHECEQTPGNAEGQGSLACCRPWGCKESDMTEWLNTTTRLLMYVIYLWGICAKPKKKKKKRKAVGGSECQLRAQALAHPLSLGLL